MAKKRAGSSRKSKPNARKRQPSKTGGQRKPAKASRVKVIKKRNQRLVARSSAASTGRVKRTKSTGTVRMKKKHGNGQRKGVATVPAARRAKPADRPAVPQRTVEVAAVRKKSAPAVSSRTAPAKMTAETAKPQLRRALPKGARPAAPVPPPAPPVGKKGKKGAMIKGGRVNNAANEAFMHAVIPTRIERLEILRQLYDKRKESPTKPDGSTARPAEEEEGEAEFVVSDEIVSSDSSEA